MRRQLKLSFIAEQSQEVSTGTQLTHKSSNEHEEVERLAQSLRPRVLELLSTATGELSITELRNALGYPGKYLDEDPLANPVNRILKQMRDAGEVACREFERGDPLFSLEVNNESDTSSETASHNDEKPSRDSEPLVRPDRQITFDGRPHWEWPKPQHDRATITVDRITDDIDGSAHRFVIKRGDTVEVFFARDKLDIGEVVGISNANQEVRVRFREGTEGIWFYVGKIYPVAPHENPSNGGSPLSGIIEVTNQEPQGGFDESDRVHDEPYSLQAFREYRERYEAGETSLAEHRREFSSVQATSDSFVDRLKRTYDAQRLKALASHFGCCDAKRNNKQQNAEHVLRVIVQSFTLSGTLQYDPMSETVEEAVARQVESATEDEWQRHLAERAEQAQTELNALNDPETLADFRLFVREKGVEALTEQQRVRFDQLLADDSRATRQAKRSSDTVAQFQSPGMEGLQLTIKEGWHDKQQCKLWIVQVSERVDRTTYDELNRKAKMLGGWYSSFKKADAGFQFTSEEHAHRFLGLQGHDANRSDVLADRKSRKLESASERLTSVASTLQAEADEILDADDARLKNTARRAEMAAGMRGKAYANRAMASTLRSIAAALAAGEAKYLDGLRAATHIHTLITCLRRGKTRRNETLLAEKGTLGVWDRHQASQELSNRPMTTEDAAFVKFPYPSIYRRHIEELVAQAQSKRGLKQRSRRLQPFLITDRDKHVVDFVDQGDIEFLADYLRLCRRAGLETQWVESGLEDYNRLRAANIHTPQELRSALRELVLHLAKREEDDPVRQTELQLVGVKIPGFFPTPKAIISRMLELADIQPGHRVLEPSAGKGDILDMIRQRHADADITAIEINGTLHEVLAAKDHNVQRGDFLEHRGVYDRVLMNPPFESLADVDHVRHAYDQLAADGRLVAIMSHGPFFRSDRKGTEFRDWLEQVAGNHEELPDDAFKGADAFRPTGVKTQLVVIDRPAVDA